MQVWEKSMAGKGDSMYRGLDLGVCFLCLRNTKKASATVRKNKGKQDFVNKLIQNASKGVK